MFEYWYSYVVCAGHSRVGLEKSPSYIREFSTVEAAHKDAVRCRYPYWYIEVMVHEGKKVDHNGRAHNPNNPPVQPSLFFSSFSR